MKSIARLPLSFLILLLSACGTLEITVDRTATPDLNTTATVGALQTQNAQLATRIATLNPVSAALTMDSSSEAIRQKMQASSTLWRTIFVDGTITWYPPDGGSGPQQVFHEQDWMDYPNHRFRALVGPAGSPAETFKACDGATLLETDLKTGQSQVRPLPEFARQLPSSPGQDMLWSQIGTPLAEIVLSASYSGTGGLFKPLETETIAGRQTLVVDWTREGNSQHSFRAWVDVEMGVILKFQEFGKAGGVTLQGERVVNQVVYNPAFPDSLFTTPVSPPQFSDISGNLLTPTAVVPTPSNSADPLGQVYFFIFDHNYGHETTQLVRLPGSCVTGRSACPEPANIPTPVPFNFSLTPLVWSPGGKLAALAYPVSNDKTVLSIFEPVGRSWTSLTEFNFIDPPMWSPDGNWLAFREQDGQGGEDIYAIRRDGTGLTNLTASGKLPPESRPYALEGWVKDSVLLLPARPGMEGRVYLLNPFNGDLKLLFETLLIKSQLVPSPDGENLAYYEYSDNSPKLTLKLIDLAGTTLHELGVFQGGSINPVIWSPDGARLAFGHVVNPPENQDVYVVNRDGSGLSQVYRGNAVSTLAFSPDGGSLLIQDNDVTGRHIFLIDLASLDQHMLQAPGLPLDWWWLAPSWQKQ